MLLCTPSHSLLVFQLWKISTICYTSAERKMLLKNMTLLTEQWKCILLALAMVHFTDIFFETRNSESNITQIILPKCSEKELLMPQSKKDFQSLILISWFLKINCSSAANHVCAFHCLQDKHFPRCFWWTEQLLKSSWETECQKQITLFNYASQDLGAFWMEKHTTKIEPPPA